MFAPIVIVCRNWMGKVKFNKLRGKAHRFADLFEIALHSKTITKICNRFGIESSTRQNFIRTARDNGKWLGLLA